MTMTMTFSPACSRCKTRALFKQDDAMLCGACGHSVALPQKKRATKRKAQYSIRLPHVQNAQPPMDVVFLRRKNTALYASFAARCMFAACDEQMTVRAHLPQRKIAVFHCGNGHTLKVLLDKLGAFTAWDFMGRGTSQGGTHGAAV